MPIAPTSRRWLPPVRSNGKRRFPTWRSPMTSRSRLWAMRSTSRTKRPKAIPHSILLKPGKLTDDEMATMREHCYLGYRIISRIPFLAEAAEIVYSHQERYDGSGYPRSLKGDQIPLGARMFSIADTLDAMTTTRVYRPAQSFEAARKEIELWSGRQFDPQIVKVFLDMPGNIWEDLRNDINGPDPK